MDSFQISRNVNCKSTIADQAIKEKKLLKLHGITCAVQVKIKKLTIQEILQNTNEGCFARDPAGSQSNSELTFCAPANSELRLNKTQMKLQLHKLKSHKKVKPPKCEQPGCKYASKKPVNLLNHMRNFHRILPPLYHCTHIDCEFSTRYKPSIKVHAFKVHQEKPYVCKTCQKGFKTSYQLKLHMKVHVEQKLSCKFPNCDFKYLTYQTYKLKTHMMTHTNEKPFKCTQCGTGTRTAQSLRLHMQLHEDEDKQSQNRVFKCTFGNCKFSSNQNSNLKSHLATHSELKPFKCTWPECTYTARSKRNLKRHMIVHSKDKPFICNFCNVAYLGSCELEIHVRTHTGEKPFKCSYKDCEYSAAALSALRGHIKFRHNKEDRKHTFACPLCSKSISRISGVERHMRTHTGERPYNCRYCKRDFTQSGTRIVHERVCKVRLSDENIKVPLKSKSKFFVSCQFCNREFGGNYQKSIQEMCCKMRTDGDVVKPHKCRYCARGFTWREILRDHERCCSSRPDGKIIKPFKCPFLNCKYAASWRSNLGKHKKICILRKTNSKL